MHIWVIKLWTKTLKDSFLNWLILKPIFLNEYYTFYTWLILWKNITIPFTLPKIGVKPHNIECSNETIKLTSASIFNQSGHSDHWGWGVMRRYSFPEGTWMTLCSGNIFLASSGEIDGTTMHWSPLHQLEGVATFFSPVSWRESITRRISLKIYIYHLMNIQN